MDVRHAHGSRNQAPATAQGAGGGFAVRDGCSTLGGLSNLRLGLFCRWCYHGVQYGAALCMPATVNEQICARSKNAMDLMSIVAAQ